MEVDAKKVQELRTRTGAGFMDCKKALSASGGDIKVAEDHLRKENLARAASRTGRSAQEGLVESYIHPGNRVGVLVEVNCETDFVARTDDFKNFVRDIALHIAAARPLAVSREEVPQEAVERERAIFRDQAEKEGKKAEIAERVVEGRMRKFYEETALLDQVFVRDFERSEKERRTIDALVKEKIALLGENIVVRRFARFALGEE